MEELGLEVFDANGKLRPLNETFQDLNGKLGEMSDEDRINVLNTMFNKVDLKSVNALLANSGERFDELSGYIRDSAGAAEDMAETMNDNLKGKLTILGSALEGLGIEMYEEFQQPLKEAAETAIKSVDSISASLKNGKLSESMASVARGIGTIVSKAAELAIGALPKLIDGFAFLVDHAKLLGTVLASTAGAVVTFKSTMLINDIVKSWNAAATAARMFGAGMTSSLTGTQAVVGALKGNISKLGAVTAALGGPMGVAALAVAGVTAGIVALTIATRDDNSELSRNKKAIEELNESLEESEKAWEAIEERRQESINTSFAEIDNTERQIDALKELIDENGKVKDGYEDKAKALADQINSVIPEAISLAEDESGAYVKVADSIDLMIAKKKINALIDANQESYANALKENKDIVEKYADALEEQRIAEENLAKINADLTLNEWEYSEAVREAEENLNNANQAVKNLGKQYEENTNIMIEQDNLLTASKSESVEEINNAIASQGVALQQYTATQLEEADKQLQNEKEKLANLEIMHQQFNNEYTQSELEAQQKRVDEAQKIRDEAYAEAEQASRAAGEAQVVAMADGINGQVEAVKAAALRIRDEAIETVKGIQEKMLESGKNAALGFANGLKDSTSINSIINNAMSLGSIAITYLNKSLDERSPSKETEKSGKYFDEGMAIGIEKNKGSVIESVEDLAESSLSTAREQAEEYKDIGDLFGENYLAGIKGSFDEITKTLEKNIDEQTEIYKDAIDEQTEIQVEKVEKQLEDLKEAHTKSEKELQEQIKKTKSESQKQLLEQQSKNAKEQYNQRKKELEKDKKQIQDSNKEKIAAQKEAYKEFGKVTKEALSSAYSQIEKEAKKRVDAVTDIFQSQKDEILSIQEDLYNKTSVFDELFEYDSETGTAKINDINKIQQEKLKYYEELNKLAERSSSKDFVKEIAGLSIDEAMAYMKEFDRMSDSEFNQFVEKWKSLNEEMKKQSEMFLQSELSELDEKYNKEMQMTIEGIKQYSREVLKGIWDEFLAILPEEFAEKIDPSTFDRLMQETEEKLSKLYGGFEDVEKENSLTVLIKAETVDFSKEVTKQIPGIQEAGSEATVALGEQIGKDGKKVVTEADDVGEDTVRALESHEPEFQQVGEEYMDRLIAGMQSKWDTAVNVAHEIAESLKDELEDVASFSMRDTDDAMSARSLMESVEPAMISRLYNSMVDSIGFYQSRLAAASTSYITNNSSSRVENNMGDVNFNIAEVKGENADRSISKMMEQAEFYRRQKRLAVGVK